MPNNPEKISMSLIIRKRSKNQLKNPRHKKSLMKNAPRNSFTLSRIVSKLAECLAAITWDPALTTSAPTAITLMADGMKNAVRTTSGTELLTAVLSAPTVW